ncbi:DUF4160 domain-containing protein [Sphingosinicella humi]|uniref:DUF4160 domain-containing protein n=1 Tax=Allosphingosinicella humi TaxID=2068657 RepID=A0A2U2IZ03_9SPHN|nr:DUF4160 domain-containing protein [Sphingosinicella humi]PWG01323.1 DUF4160 domain-containing protein [Sphingosinicella humi]
MVTVHREAGLRFIIFVDDHEPAHVHVIGDGTAKINLTGPSGEPELVYNDGFKAGEEGDADRGRAAGVSAGEMERISWLN